MQLIDQYEHILEICRDFLADTVDEYGNIPHRGVRPRCSDVEVLAAVLFQEALEIECDTDFFTFLHSEMPELADKIHTRRNYNARRNNVSELFSILKRNIMLDLELSGQKYTQGQSLSASGPRVLIDLFGRSSEEDDASMG
jgi:hypothetical protein